VTYSSCIYALRKVVLCWKNMNFLFSQNTLSLDAFQEEDIKIML